MGIYDRDYMRTPREDSNRRSPHKHHWRNIWMASATAGLALGVLRMLRESPLEEVLLVIGCTSLVILLCVRQGLLKGAVWIVIFLTLILCLIAFQFPTFRDWLKNEYQQIKIRLFWRGENSESTMTQVFAGLPNGQTVVIENNPNAINPSWNELLNFLKNDKTDTCAYIEDKFVCANFALMLHNNAEIAGWRCAYVCVYLSGEVYHALNAFKTTDYGLVYIDCTNGDQGPSNMDHIVQLKNGMDYLPKNIFPEEKWGNSKSMGIISNIEIYW